MKNYIKEGQKLPLFGIGPYLMAGVFLVTAIFIIVFNYVMKSGVVSGIWITVFRLSGAVLIIIGLLVWYKGAVSSDIDNLIADNKLKTDGVFACVRNPMYSGIWLVITGFSMMWHNYLVLLSIPVNWIIITVVLKNTEEKWLLETYGQQYLDYKRRVNRLIPWFTKPENKKIQ